MSPFEKTIELDDEVFLRKVGISKENFVDLLERVYDYITAEKEFQPMKKRGRLSKMSLEDKLLMALTYLRHYPTFARLGEEFGICESYANKITHQMLDIVVKVLKLPNRKQLMSEDLQVIAIDVTEQPIERPRRRQKSYYSGKKNATP